MNAALAGFCLFAAIHHFNIWRRSRRERASLLFAAYCSVAATLCADTIALSMSTTIAEGQRALDARAVLGMTAAPLMVWVIQAMTRAERRWAIALTGVFATGALFHLLVAPIGGAVISVTPAPMPWGEPVSLIEVRPSPVWATIGLLAGIAIPIYAIAGARRMTNDRFTASLVSSGSLLWLIANLLPGSGQFLGQRLPYIAAPSVLFVFIVSLALSHEYARRGDALVAGEQRFRAMIDQTFQFIGLLNLDGRVQEANRTALDFAGISEADVLGRFFWDTKWWAHSEPLQRQLRDATQRAGQGEVVRFEATHPRASGELAYVDFSLKPVRDELGRVTMLLAEGHDITERYLAERQLRASEDKSRTLIEFAPDAIVVVDLADGRFVDFNQRACDLLGYPPDALRQRNPVDCSPPTQPDGRESRIGAGEYLAAAVEGAIPEFEWMHRHADGHLIPCYVRLVRLPDPSRLLIRGNIQDITERRRLEAQLAQSQKMEAMGQLAGGVAHDFNNLLMVISGHGGLLHDELGPGHSGQMHLTAITKAAQQAAWLTERLLAFSRRAVMVPKAVHLNSAVRETERMLRRIIGEDVHLSVRIDDAAGHILIDPGQCSQVLMNLVVNARDAMPTGGTLTLETRRVNVDEHFAATRPLLKPGPHVCLIVADTGSGIPPEARARIFEPFFTTKDVGKGTGLGLAAVHGIVTQAGGWIDVESEVGVGTRFSIYVPEIDRAPAAPVPGDVTRLVGAGETVLLVEDEAAVRNVVSMALREQGFRVLAAPSGDEALRLVEAGVAPDLLATDMVMPGMSGRELADRLEARFPRLKVLFMSGYTDDIRLRHGALGPDEEYLQKPFALSALGRTIRDLLNRP